jgi:hypothetical protein
MLSFSSEYFLSSCVCKTLQIRIYRTVPILHVALYWCETCSVTLREMCKIKELRLFGPNTEYFITDNITTWLTTNVCHWPGSPISQ